MTMGLPLATSPGSALVCKRASTNARVSVHVNARSASSYTEEDQVLQLKELLLPQMSQAECHKCKQEEYGYLAHYP